MSEYIKHCRHFDGLGMGDSELESQAKALEDVIKEFEEKAHILPAKNNALRAQIEKKDKLIESLKIENKRYRECLESIAAESEMKIPTGNGWTYTYSEMAAKALKPPER